MTRDTANLPQYNQRPEWETMPKTGAGSEYNRDNKELARRRKFGFMPKKTSIEDLPWILTSKAATTESTKDSKTSTSSSTAASKDKQYIGKKSVSENSSYFVFIKCADGGFEAHPLEDWYSFAPHKTYKTLNFEEAEEEFKRRHKILNKYVIMANKRRNKEGDEDDEDDIDGDGGDNKKKLSGMSSMRASKDTWLNDGDDKKKKGKSYKASNLSDEDDDDDPKKKKIVSKVAPKKKK